LNGYSSNKIPFYQAVNVIILLKISLVVIYGTQASRKKKKLCSTGYRQLSQQNLLSLMQETYLN